MARWRLMASHYLFTEEGTEWEYSEVDRSTGRQRRVKFPVPTLLDITDPAQWTEKEIGLDGKPVAGAINVSDGNNPGRGDVIFKGSPTPDMEPIDEEANRITDKYRPKWNWSANWEAGSYSQNLIDGMQEQLAALQLAQQKKEETAGLSEFMQSMVEIQKQNAELMKQVIGRRG